MSPFAPDAESCNLVETSKLISKANESVYQ